MKFIIGYKKEMTQQYREDGSVVPVTVVKAEPIVVTQVKSTEKEGYNAIQLGIGGKRKAGKSLKGHLASFITSGRKPFSKLVEVRVEDSSKYKVGDSIGVNVFQQGDVVNVTGVSKGKGFQGVVKRHGFAGSPASHGHKDQLRMPGSIGAQDPQHVFKGTRMGGRMGGDKVTVKNLEIVEIDAEGGRIFVKGALPGSRNSLVQIMGEGEVGDIMINVFEKKEKESKGSSAEENQTPDAKDDKLEKTEEKPNKEPKAKEKLEEAKPEQANKESES